MLYLKKPCKVKLIIGILYNDSYIYNGVVSLLKERFGEIDFESQEYPFNFTNYYEPEMGTNLKKRIISFKQLIKRDKLADIKLYTNNIEKGFCKGNKRTINLDPGYLTLHNIVLASTKELPHKVSVGKGIFGDVVLIFRNKQFVTSRHTFPDFKDGFVQGVLVKIRKMYKQDLKQQNSTSL